MNGLVLPKVDDDLFGHGQDELAPPPIAPAHQLPRLPSVAVVIPMRPTTVRNVVCGIAGDVVIYHQHQQQGAWNTALRRCGRLTEVHQ